MVQAAWDQSARTLMARAFALAVHDGERVSTLHLAAAVLEQQNEHAAMLQARGVSGHELAALNRLHPEAPGTFERVQSLARQLATSCAGDATATHLLVAALGQRETALGAVVHKLGHDPQRTADELLRNQRGPRRPARRAILHSGGAHAPAPAPARSLEATEGAARGPQSLGAVVARQGKILASAPAAANSSNTRPASVLPSGAPSIVRVQAATMHSIPVARGLVSGQPTVKGSGHRRIERTEYDLDPRTFPALGMFARNLSAEHARGVLDPVVGRERECVRVLDAIARRDGRGALVVGAPGIGKSTLVRAIARDAGSRSVLMLRHAEIAGQSRAPAGAERARMLVSELVKATDRVIVALDPLAPWLVGRDIPDDVAVELRAALSSGRLAWIGTATSDEARKLLEAEPWIERQALRVELEEPQPAELRDMVRAFGPAISAHHGVVVEPSVFDHAVELSDRYLGGRAQPDRALSVIDLALSRARRLKLAALSKVDLAGVVSELGGIPFDRVAATDQERLLALETTLGERIVGHAHALARVSQTLRRNAVGFRGSRPVGTFLFLGPTGVGKTETAKAVADVLFPGSGAMTRFDMAEFSESHSVARLVGAPPGYVGYQDGGQLTEAVRRRPYQLILLDEIEKAHRDVLESLLALLDEGRMTDGRGRMVDFRNTVIVMTSNLGADLYDRATLAPARAIGFAPTETAAAPTARLDERVRDAARQALPPELWNRIDDPVVFAPLSRDEVREIARRLLAQSFARLQKEQGIEASARPAVVELLLDNGGFEPSLGARPMRRAIARLVEAPIAEAVLRGQVRSGDSVTLEARDWGVEVSIGRRAAE